MSESSPSTTSIPSPRESINKLSEQGGEEGIPNNNNNSNNNSNTTTNNTNTPTTTTTTSISEGSGDHSTKRILRPLPPTPPLPRSSSISSSSSSSSPTLLPSLPLRPHTKSLFGQLSTDNNNNNPSSSSSMDYKSLSHVSDILFSSAESGLSQQKRIGELLKKIATLQSTMAIEIKKLIDNEKLKEERIDRPPYMPSSNKAWEYCEEWLIDYSKYHADMASSLMIDIAVPLIEFSTGGLEKKKELQKDDKKLESDMNTAHNQVLKTLSKCDKLIYGAQLAEGKVKEHQINAVSNAPLREKQFNTSSILSIISTKVSQLKKVSPEEQREKIYTAVKEYESAVIIANQKQYQLHLQQKPQIMDQLQSLQKNRLESLHNAFQSMNNIIQQSSQSFQRLSNNFQSKIASTVDVNTDLMEGIKVWKSMYSDPPEPVSYVYILPCTPDDAKHGKYEGNPNSVFHSTLEHCMKLQSDYDGSLSVPRILIALKERFYQLNGPTIEGVFRISPTKTDLELIHQQIDNNNYDFQSFDIHTISGCLKEWLRMLSEPLISLLSYNDCINIGKKYPIGAPNDECKQLINNIIIQQNQLSIAVLKELFLLVNDVAKNHEKNKMTYDNLAVVLAPAILRFDNNNNNNNNNDQSMDAVTIMMNSKYEARFVSLLFQSNA